MLEKEAIWIGKEIEKITKIKKIKKVLDIGSSSLYFRKKVQPYIYTEIFQKLEKKGIKIDYLDKKEEEGITLVYDLDNIDKINKKFDLILCANVLEHVLFPKQLIDKIKKLLTKKGILIISVPFHFRYHADPIDTFFRPSLDELITLLKNYKIISYITIVNKNKRLLFNLASIKQIIIDKKYSYLYKNLLYLLNNEKINCVIVEK